MNISELLQKNGLFSKDIKQRISNKQILMNGKPLTKEELKLNVVSSVDAGDFVFNNIKKINKISFLTLEEMFQCNIPFVQNIFSGMTLIKLSKKQSLIVELE